MADWHLADPPERLPANANHPIPAQSDEPNQPASLDFCQRMTGSIIIPAARPCSGTRFRDVFATLQIKGFPNGQNA
jgi:hypothetical protein